MVWAWGGSHAISRSETANKLLSDLLNAPEWSALWWLKWVGVGWMVFMLLWCALIIVLGIWFPHVVPHYSGGA